MKPILKFFIPFLLLGIFACQKGEVPDSNAKYIGSWQNTSDTTNSYRILINADGTAEYHEKSISGYKDITGFIFFNGYDFKIGTKYFAGVKFKTNKIPQRVTIGVNPYKYYLIATFNDIEYKNDNNTK